VSVYDFFYLAEAASIGIEEEVETQSKLYSRLAYQTVIPHIDSSKMSFKKWMDMWHPPTGGSGNQAEEEKKRIIEQGLALYEEVRTKVSLEDIQSEGAKQTQQILEN